MDICSIISLITGLYLIISALALNTKNFSSSLVFKIIPFFLGCGCIFVALKLLNVISIN